MFDFFITTITYFYHIGIKMLLTPLKTYLAKLYMRYYYIKYNMVKQF